VKVIFVRLPALLAAATLAAGSVVLVGSAQAAPGHAAHDAKPVVLHLGDPRHDLLAIKQTHQQDGSTSTTTTDTKYQPTAAEAALDLTGVDYKLVRSGHRPALHIAWHVAGPIPAQHGSDVFSTATDLTTFGVEVAHTPLLIMVDNLGSTGVQNLSSFKAVKCTGFSSSMGVGHTTATATVPLSCLAPGAPTKAKGGLLDSLFGRGKSGGRTPKKTFKPPTSVALRAETTYVESTGTLEDSTTISINDFARATRPLNLTPLH
jgi:hypothetical protein